MSHDQIHHLRGFSFELSNDIDNCMNRSSDDLMTDTVLPAGDNGVTEVARGRGIAAWRQIADEIEADIRSERLRAGMQLPTESQLATRFAVNRHTVRRSLAELAARGLVRATQGRGTFRRGQADALPDRRADALLGKRLARRARGRRQAAGSL
ncbi:MAG: GntR family transcriptional regulator [Candidatus Kaistia colombiensis]|nr:MAG: GntR family transcriptional regulator [Kaistia sp.]